MHALRNGTVVDVDGTREADVGIENGEVVAVGDVPDADTEADVSGQYVAPGLVDAHVHLMMDGRADVESVVDDTAYSHAYRAAQNLRAAVEHGVTTVRDLGAPTTLALDAADAVAEGGLPGPRVLAVGENVVMTGGHGHWFGREADGPAEVRKAVREQLKRGADAIKCMATGGVLTSGAQTGSPELTPAELEALVDAASAKNAPTCAHAHGAEGIKNAVRAGIDSIEHGTFMDEEAARLMAEHDVTWVPTLSALKGFEGREGAGIPEEAMAKAEEAGEKMHDAWEHALEYDVTIAMGTDAGTPFNFFADIPTELAYMCEYGLTPEDALAAATVEGADALGLDDVGRVAEGYRADLVVLDADPTADVSTWQDPDAVFADGEQVV